MKKQKQKVLPFPLKRKDKNEILINEQWIILQLNKFFNKYFFQATSNKYAIHLLIRFKKLNLNRIVLECVREENNILKGISLYHLYFC